MFGFALVYLARAADQSDLYAKKPHEVVGDHPGMIDLRVVCGTPDVRCQYDILEAEDWVREQLEAGERIMGFGHRVYRVRDPRADVLAEVAERLFKSGADPALYRDALAVERVVLRLLDERKPERALRTNVEFYTALVLHGVGLETPLFTPTFAIARVGGWTAHVLEQAAENRLIRPRVAYRGPEDRRWVPTDARV